MPGIEGDFEESSLLVIKYVDGTTVVETVDGNKSVKHFTTRKTLEQFYAPALTRFMTNLVQRASEIGMRVNCKKTQLICVSPDNGCHSQTSVMVGGELIESTDSVKLLGFMINSRGDMSDQCDLIKRKFRSKFWSLVHWKKSGIIGKILYDLYVCFVRPVIETNCVIYHPMLTRKQSNEIEMMQKLAVKMCYGFNRHYDEIIASHNIRTLEQRRELAVRKFTLKSLENERFSGRWFCRRPEIDTNIRRRRPFVENRAATNRYKNSPLLHLQKIANTLV